MHKPSGTYLSSERPVMGRLIERFPDRLIGFPTEFNLYDYAFYRGKMYHYDRASEKEYYLYVCDTPAADPSILMTFKAKTVKPMLSVNRYGIFLIFVKSNNMEVQVFSHQGTMISTITIDEKPGDNRPYLCDKKIFQIVKDGSVLHAMVFELDIENSSYTSKMLYQGEFSREDPKFRASFLPRCVLGSSDYALVLVDYHFLYSRGKGDCLDASTGAWQYISLKDSRMYCLSNPAHSPELLKDEPLAYIRYLEDPQKITDWFIPGHIDIGNNLIWLYGFRQSPTGGDYYLIPGDLRPDFYKHRRKDFPAWKLAQDLIPNASIERSESSPSRYYFDGKYMFSSQNCYDFHSYNKDGEMADWGGSHGSCDHFHVEGDVLFLDSNITYNASLLDLTRYRYDDHKERRLPVEIRTDWSYGPSVADNQMLAKAKDLFEKKQKEKQSIKPKKTNDLVDRTGGTPLKTGNVRQSAAHSSFATAIPSTPPADPGSKLEYWDGFAKYLSGRIPSNVRIPKAADRNWFAMRLGSSKVRIECSVSSKKQQLRVGLFMENSDSVYGKAEGHKAQINSLLANTGISGAEIRWDNTVADANVSVFIPSGSLSIAEQYEAMKHVICQMTEALQYINL